jgi:hypothetical protein
MKSIVFVAAVVCLVGLGCSKHNNQGSLKSVPECIGQKIQEIKSQPKWNPPAEVNEYEYQGKRVYLFSSNCCDQYNVAYDKNCTPVCAPSGGFTGGGDGLCKNFFEEAKHIGLVWKDER